MSFAQPSYLWALTALAIPLAIHLLSRKEGRVIKVGSIRHVEESNTSQFKSIRLNEIFLLLLRMLMVMLLALFLSGAQCSRPVSDNIKWVVVEKGIDPNQVDSLVTKGYELHQMPRENYWAYVQELNSLPHEIIVVSYSKAENFRGERVALNENIKWITAESTPTTFQALAWQAGDSVFVRTGKSSTQETTYSTSVGVPDSIQVVNPKQVVVNTKDKIVIAALGVLKKEYGLPIRISNNEQGIINVEVKEEIGPLVEKISSSEIRINKALDQDIALNENLVIELFKVLYPELQQGEVSKDARVLPDEFIKSDLLTSSPLHLITSSGIEKYLIMFFALSLAAERFVAIRRNQ